MSVAIIDGDVLCYEACSPRWHDKVVNKTNFVKLDEDGKVVPLEFTADEDVKYMTECWENLMNLIEIVKSRTFCTDYVMAVKGSRDFRYDLFADYKAARHNRDKNTAYNQQMRAVPHLRTLLAHRDMALEGIYREADDYVRTWALEARRQGIPYVVCTIDKDLKCIPGKHFHLKSHKLTEITEGEARNHYYKQILMGDPTDGIPGVKGIGPKSCDKILGDSTDEAELQELVIGSYMSAYGDEWYSYLLLNAKLIHIQRNLEDWFSLKEWKLIQQLQEEGLV